jgi:hypothetical protein
MSEAKNAEFASQLDKNISHREKDELDAVQDQVDVSKSAAEKREAKAGIAKEAAEKAKAVDEGEHEDKKKKDEEDGDDKE